MKELDALPEDCQKYKFIVDEFLKVPNVEKIGFQSDATGLSFALTNNKTGSALKIWSFPIRQKINTEAKGFIDSTMYDILDLDDPGIMIALGLKKAEMFFKDK